MAARAVGATSCGRIAIRTGPSAMAGMELTTTATCRTPVRSERMNTVTVPDSKASRAPITHPAAAS
jgi:hypothetical protein